MLKKTGFSAGIEDDIYLSARTVFVLKGREEIGEMSGRGVFFKGNIL